MITTVKRRINLIADEMLKIANAAFVEAGGPLHECKARISHHSKPMQAAWLALAEFHWHRTCATECEECPAAKCSDCPHKPAHKQSL